MKHHSLVLFTVFLVSGCASQPPVHHAEYRIDASNRAQAGTAPVAAGARTVFPHVRVDLASGTVEFDGIVPIDAHDPQAPRVDLELIACTPDTREHESLVVTRATASQVHAALLLAGLTPGTPGAVEIGADGARMIEPRGPGVDIRLRWKDQNGVEREAGPADWVVSWKDGSRPNLARGTFCFAGSRLVSRQDPRTGALAEVYDADGAGTLIGLATFGSETIAWRTVYSPDSAISDPQWTADRTSVPPYGTAVTVTLRPIERH